MLMGNMQILFVFIFDSYNAFIIIYHPVSCQHVLVTLNISLIYSESCVYCPTSIKNNMSNTIWTSCKPPTVVIHHCACYGGLRTILFHLSS